MNPRVLVAGLFHETHTFLDGVTPLTAFEARKGQDILGARGDRSPLCGFLEVAEAQGWHLIPAIDMRATPGATVTDEVLETFWDGLQSYVTKILGERLDAVYLVLHGAMVCETEPDVEGELLARLRQLIGESVPVFGVFDLHANLSERMARHADALLGYRENPHTDARAAAVRARRTAR